MGREAQGLVVRTGADIVGVDFHRSLEYCTLTRDNIEGSRGTVTRLFLLKKEVQCPFEFLRGATSSPHWSQRSGGPEI